MKHLFAMLFASILASLALVAVAVEQTKGNFAVNLKKSCDVIGKQ